MYEFVLLLFCLNVLYLCGANLSEGSGKYPIFKKFKQRKLDDNINWQIVGGRVADPFEFNYQASVVYKKGFPVSEKICTGVIITKGHILSSALCICDFSESYCHMKNLREYQVYVGTGLFLAVAEGQVKLVEEPTGTQSRRIAWDDEETINYPYFVSRIDIHPDFLHQDLNVVDRGQYVVSIAHDIAVLSLYRDLLLSDTVKPIPLPGVVEEFPIMDRMEQAHEECTVYGWGFKHTPVPGQESKAIPKQLHYARMSLIPFKNCYTRWRADGFQLSYGSHVCAVSKNQGICTGDGGGGLVCGHKLNKFLLGIVSIAYSCGMSNVPSVFTRVDVYMGFIRSIIGYDDITKSAMSVVDSIEPLPLLHYFFFYITVYCFLWIFNQKMVCTR